MSSEEQHKAAEAGTMKNVTQVINTLEGGAFLRDLNGDYAETVRAIISHAQNTGAASGGVTIKLDLKMVEGVMEVRGTVATKVPKRPTVKTVFWATPEGNLTEQNPKQANLPFAEVPKTNRDLA